MNAQFHVFEEGEPAQLTQDELPFCDFAKVPDPTTFSLSSCEIGMLAVLDRFRFIERGAPWIERTIGEISQAKQCSRTTVTTNLKKLENRGFISLERFKDNSFRIHFLYDTKPVKELDTLDKKTCQPSTRKLVDPRQENWSTLGKKTGRPSTRKLVDPYRARTRETRGNSKNEEEEKQNAREIVDVGHGSPSTTPAKTKDQNADREGLPLFRPRAETPETPPDQPKQTATPDSAAPPDNAAETTPDVVTSPPPPAVAAPDSGPAAAIAGTSDRPNDAMAEPYPVPSGPPWPPPSRVHLLRPGLFAHYRTLSLESTDPKDIREARIRLWLHDQAVRHELAGGALSDTIQMELPR